MDTLRKAVIFLVAAVLYNLVMIAKYKIFKSEPQIYEGVLYGGNVILLIVGLGFIFG